MNESYIDDLSPFYIRDIYCHEEPIATCLCLVFLLVDEEEVCMIFMHIKCSYVY